MSRASTLRVATYNIRRGIGTDRRYDLPRVAGVLAAIDADVVALQEVDVAGRDQLATLASQLGCEAIAGPALVRRRATTGNGLLTRLPVLRFERLDLSRPGREPRGAVVADLDLGDTTLRCLCTHLGLRASERRAQVERIAAALAAWEGPCLVMGDFNSVGPLAYPVRRLGRLLGRAPAPATFPAWRPLLALDRIWLRPRAALRRVSVPAGPDARVASDHRPLTAEIDLRRAQPLRPGEGPRVLDPKLPIRG